MPRLRLCKMRVIKYYVKIKHKALFDAWKYGRRKQGITILWGLTTYVKHDQKQRKSCSFNYINALYAKHAIFSKRRLMAGYDNRPFVLLLTRSCDIMTWINNQITQMYDDCLPILWFQWPFGTYLLTINVAIVTQIRQLTDTSTKN